jgi:hypothetical protein
MKLSTTMESALLKIAKTGKHTGCKKSTFSALLKRDLVVRKIGREAWDHRVQITPAGYRALGPVAQKKFDESATAFNNVKPHKVKVMFAIKMNHYGALMARAEWHTS